MSDNENPTEQHRSYGEQYRLRWEHAEEDKRLLRLKIADLQQKIDLKALERAEERIAELETQLKESNEQVAEYKSIVSGLCHPATDLKVVQGFVERVERRAEANIEKTGKLEGAHYAAMKAEFADMEDRP